MARYDLMAAGIAASLILSGCDSINELLQIDSESSDEQEIQVENFFDPGVNGEPVELDPITLWAGSAEVENRGSIFLIVDNDIEAYSGRWAYIGSGSAMYSVSFKLKWPDLNPTNNVLFRFQSRRAGAWIRTDIVVDPSSADVVIRGDVRAEDVKVDQLSDGGLFITATFHAESQSDLSQLVIYPAVGTAGHVRYLPSATGSVEVSGLRLERIGPN